LSLNRVCMWQQGSSTYLFSRDKWCKNSFSTCREEIA
jgi:hypothetical protein